MDTPSPDRWHRIERLVDAVLEVPNADRVAWLRAACGDDAALCDEVLALVEAGERDDAFLASPAPLVGAVAKEVAAMGAAPRTAIPQRVGPYRILSELGRGGMGTVYLAEREAHFQQRVALKVVGSGLHIDDLLQRRFVEERQILASLEHANIARLLDGGVTDDGAPWFAMELVDGEPIDRWCDARRLSLEARLELFGTLCAAVEYAHAHQVVHRDLKPSNILVRADGTLKLLDFGVAKMLAADPDEESLTRTGARLLTPEYASPEQIRGDAISPASDVYSLGAVLYELLTGRRPYRLTGRTRREIERAVLDQMPTRPSVAVRRAADDPSGRDGEAATDTSTRIAHARGTTPDRLAARLRDALDGIVLNALAKDPRHRYPSARALGADVQRYLSGLPVRAQRRSPRVAIVSAAVVALLSVPAVLLYRASKSPDAPPRQESPVTAVGLVADYRDPGTQQVARSLADLLATNLARVPSLRVVSTARLYELMGQLATSGADAGAYSSAARRAGASTLIDGGLYRVDSAGLRLDLRRIDLATGNVLAVFTISGHDIFTLVDSGTARLAAHLGATAPQGSVTDVTTSSEVAYRLYEEGLRAYYHGDITGTRRLMEAALKEDSTLAMAEYYLSHTLSGATWFNHLARALRLAQNASDRERLIIRSALELYTSDPAAIATAETLAVRFPHEPEGQRMAGKALIDAADFPGAVRRLRQLIASDSVAQRGTTARCTACDAQFDLVGAYLAMDSLETAEREGRAFAAREPASAALWSRLAEVLVARGRIDAAREAYGRATEIDPGFAGRPSYFAYYYLPAGDYETADRALREIAQSGSHVRQAEANWYLTLSLRNQGRHVEALRAARMHRELTVDVDVSRPREQFAFQYAQVLFELGRYRDAVALFDSIARAAPGYTASQQARQRAWALTHAATALFAAGDTARLRDRVDPIRVVGSRSLLGRDQRLHHYVAGLVLVARGDDANAVDEFRRAIISPLNGFTRTNYELAAALLRLRRPREAVTVLQPAVRGPLEGSNLYITHTELHEMLARAWDASGAPDSAVAHYRVVLNAWQRADPAFQPRLARVRARLASLGVRDSMLQR
jgi:serine/threonine protein kinase/tetratricopeptide (TPR) repeat protein